MSRFPWIALALTLALTACSGPAPNARGEAEEGHEAEEQGEHEERPQQTTIEAQTAQSAGIRAARVGPGQIADEHEVQGLLTPVEGRIALVTARFPGPVRAVRVGVGDQVKAGQVLATVESNLSLTTYSVTAPISGVVMARTASVGTSAAEGAPLFEIADLSTLWVDLHIFGRDAGHIEAGVPVTVSRLSDSVSSRRPWNACCPAPPRPAKARSHARACAMPMDAGGQVPPLKHALPLIAQKRIW